MANYVFESRLFGAKPVGQSVRIYLPATIVYRGTSFLRGIILAWLLASRMGEYSLLTIALQGINILAPLVSLGLNEAITRYSYAYFHRNRLKEFLLKSSLLVTSITFVFCVILFIFSSRIGELFFSNNHISIEESIRLARASLLTIFAITLYFLLVSVFKGLRMFLALSLLELSHGLLFLITSIAGVFYISRSAEIVIFSYIASLIIPTIFFGGLFISQSVGLEESGKSLSVGVLSRRLINYGFWAAISGIIWQSWQMISLWYLTKFCDASSGDVFAGARLIAQLIAIVGIAISAIVMASSFSKWEKGDREQANIFLDFYTKLVLLCLLGCSLLLVSFRNVIAFIFPERFCEASTIMPEITLFFYLATVLTFLAIYFVLLEKTILMLWPWTLGFVSNIVFAILWVKGNEAIVGAARAAYLSTLPAIVLTITIIFAKKQSISVGTSIIIVASGILLLPVLYAWIGYSVLLVIAIASSYIFSHEQKQILIRKLGLLSG